MYLDLDDLPLRPHRLTRARYEAWVEQGVFDGERVELISGLVVELSPENAAHAWAIGRLARALVVLWDRAEVRIQNPLIAAGESEPEPDLAVVPAGDYRHRHPDVALWVIEVSDASLAYDRGAKLRVYAASGVPEYWIVNVRAPQIEIWRGPQGDRYGDLTTVGVGSTVSPIAFPDVTIAVADLF